MAGPRIELGTHMDFQSAALPTELSRQWRVLKPHIRQIVNNYLSFFLIADFQKNPSLKIPDGIRVEILKIYGWRGPRIELGTHGFSIRCSTD